MFRQGSRRRGRIAGLWSMVYWFRWMAAGIMEGVLMKHMIVMSLLAVLVSCGGEGTEETGGASAASEVRTVAIVDSIGIELGDSNYVLGAVEKLCYGPDGNLYVFDLVRGSVMVYSPEGTFIRSIARRGEGPGEIVFPLDMTVLNDGSVMITALGGIHEYSSQGDYAGVAAEYFTNPPMNLTAAGDSSLVASKLTVEPGGDGNAVVNYWLARLDDEGQPDVVYATDQMPFDPGNLTDLLNRTWMAYSMAADREGNVYLAPNSSEEFMVDVYDDRAQLVRTISLDVPMVAKTEEEIHEEKAWMEMHLENMGVSGVLIEFEPDPYRRMITGLGLDSQGRLWARRGTELEPVFEVFSPEGEHLFTARVPGVGDAGQFWSFTIEPEGMAAFSSNPELFQQVFILRLEQ